MNNIAHYGTDITIGGWMHACNYHPFPCMSHTPYVHVLYSRMQRRPVTVIRLESIEDALVEWLIKETCVIDVSFGRTLYAVS